MRMNHCIVYNISILQEMIKKLRIYLFVLIVLSAMQTLYIVLHDWNSDTNCQVKVYENPRKVLEYLEKKTEVPEIVSKPDPYLLYIIVVSAPLNYPQRDAIRNTWGKTVSNYDSIKYSFAIGNKRVSQSDLSLVLKERDTFGDIIMLDGVEEVYTKLSRKVLQAFTWADKHIDAVYYLKTDDDSYVVIDNLYQVLTNEGLPVSRAIVGNFHHLSVPHTEGKWSEFVWFLCLYYLDFPTGVGYILTQDIVKYLSYNSDKFMHHHNEDTSLGSWVAPLKLSFLQDERIIPLGNNCDATTWLQHYITPINLRRIHSAWLDGRRLC
ncbi:Beta-1,3-galactosyltransferase 6-like [Oopsacas minuta]|uniref:Hexosyltransferase n=1 Tax=Oopsacas minuta TaxID=111878 RepID=A0AAV7JWK7_9METZ|nr:Beta-1,3-galactosyltransferase 6-like [Oopsacas minuta]